MVYTKALLYMVLLIVFTILLKPLFFLNRKKIWFFIDRPLGIDNSYHLFQYITSTDNTVTPIYLLENLNDAEYKNLLKNKNTVYNLSLKHFWYFIHAEKIILSYDTKPFFFYKQWLLFKKILKPYTKLIFLQHGVTKWHILPYSKKYTHFDMFCCVCEREKNIIQEIGYDQEIHITWFPRFDALIDTSPKNQILFLPTWNKSLEKTSESSFGESEYFHGIQKVLSSKRLHTLLEEHGFIFTFAPHYMMKEYLHLFHSHSPHIQIVDTNQKKYDIQKMMKESKILITDYSSIMFDFAYMQKPSIYYRFSDHHYDELFDVEQEGFWKIIDDKDMFLQELTHILKNKCVIDEVYWNRIQDFFYKIDWENSKRVYTDLLHL